MCSLTVIHLRLIKINFKNRLKKKKKKEKKKITIFCIFFFFFFFILQKTIRPVWAVRGLHKSAAEGKFNSLEHSTWFHPLFRTQEDVFLSASAVATFLLHSLLTSFPLSAHLLLSPPTVLKLPAPEDTVTASYGKFISEVKPQHLSSLVLQRSKRMVLDSIGVGLIGSTTDVFELALQHCQVSVTPGKEKKTKNFSTVCSLIWGNETDESNCVTLYKQWSCNSCVWTAEMRVKKDHRLLLHWICGDLFSQNVCVWHVSPEEWHVRA